VMTDAEREQIVERYHRALDAKPGKGPISDIGIVAITDSVCDIPLLLAEIADLREWQRKAVEAHDRDTGRLFDAGYRQAEDAAAIKALMAVRPEPVVKAEALREGARHYQGRMRAMDPNWRRVVDCFNLLADDIEAD